MKTTHFILLVLLAAIAFQACKTSEKTLNANNGPASNNAISKKDTIPYSFIVWDTLIGTTRESLVKKIKSIEGSDTVFEFIHYIDDPNIDTRPPKGKPITTPLPQIFTDLFPDVKWELVTVDEGFGIEYRYYQTYYQEKRYTFSFVNDFIYSRYKPGEIEDKQMIELFIYWFFHPDDSNMKVISTSFLTNKEENYFNYKSIIILNNEQIDCYSLVNENKLYGIKTYKNGTLYKQEVLIY